MDVHPLEGAMHAVTLFNERCLGSVVRDHFNVCLCVLCLQEGLFFFSPLNEQYINGRKSFKCAISP